MDLDAAGLPGERVLRLAAIGVHVDAREALAGELVGRDVAGVIECHAGEVDRSRSFGVPAGALLAHILQPHRPPDRLRQHRGIRRAVVGVVAAIGAGTGGPFDVNILQRHPQSGGQSGLDEMRLLRAGKTRHVAVLDAHKRAGRSHRACDWNGHSYSASMTFAADLKAPSTSPTFCSTVRLRAVAFRITS